MTVKDISSIGNYNPQGSENRRDRGKESFAQVYESIRRASTNDNPSKSGTSRTQPSENLKYITNLHDTVDTLRGEILARVIETARISPSNPEAVSKDINRLSSRLDVLKQKLADEEKRLSGTLLDLNI